MSFELLSEPLRRYIREKKWEELRPIQHAAIQRILSSDEHFILASRTASGKTEAAFLPILSKVDFNAPGIPVVYISPLIALINDQFLRVEELCRHLDIPVTKWHGEANRSLKEATVKAPRGVILITPESLEAMFVNKAFQVRHLFGRTRFVIIDEIHSFIGTDRGTHLQSLLSRLQLIQVSPFSIVGLSATIGDYQAAKRFTGDETRTKVLLDKTAKEIHAEFRFFKCDTQELSPDLIENLYQETKNNKVLIFPNSRGRAEEVAVKLKKRAARQKSHSNYFSHHSSVDKEVRQYVEYFAKTNQRQPFAIACTSTLELGIDIGSVDQVVQIDSTFSVASLIQRVGRSGRRDGQPSQLFVYATDLWNLLQALACWLLYREGFIEPPHVNRRPYDILLHQALSIVKGHSGIAITDLRQQLSENFAFADIPLEEIDAITQHMIATELLEKLQEEVIIGLQGEKIVNSRNFYSVFQQEENYKVLNAGNVVGQIPYSLQIREDENILLAARIWKIKNVDHDAKKIEVVQAKDGKKPVFGGGSGYVHPRIRERMLEILYTEECYDFLDEAAVTELNILRNDFKIFALTDMVHLRPLLVREKYIEVHTFTGTRINNTLQLLLGAAGLKAISGSLYTLLEIESTLEVFLRKWNQLPSLLEQVELQKPALGKDELPLLAAGKWQSLLPDYFQTQLMNESAYDFKGTREYLEAIRFVINQE